MACSQLFSDETLAGLEKVEVEESCGAKKLGGGIQCINSESVVANSNFIRNLENTSAINSRSIIMKFNIMILIFFCFQFILFFKILADLSYRLILCHPTIHTYM